MIGWLDTWGGVTPEHVPGGERPRLTGAWAPGSSGLGQVFGVSGSGLAGVTEAVAHVFGDAGELAPRPAGPPPAAVPAPGSGRPAVSDLRMAFAFRDVPVPGFSRRMALPRSARARRRG